VVGDCNPQPVQVGEGIRRVTFPLPLGIDHVHCYLLRARDGSWILVDAGLGIGDQEALWEPVLAALDAPVGRVLLTHSHPDHMGGIAAFAELTGARIAQGRLDRERAEQVWGDPAAYAIFDDFLREHGVPEEVLDRSRFHLRLPPEPELLDAGDDFDGWRVEVLPGHADGHVVLVRGDVLVAGDTILGGITPHVGVYPGGLDDPLAHFVASLERIAELQPRLALPGHGPVLEDAAGRAREIVVHHRERLDRTAAELDGTPRTAWELSRSVFGHVAPGQFVFALTETLSHLERLEALGRARRIESRPVRFSA
jgi:glyoxylase-like metal-dependent hydrolase (beta-lactamase superfamily II)